MENPKLYSKEQVPQKLTLTPEQREDINRLTLNLPEIHESVLEMVVENNDVIKTLENGHPLNRLITNPEGKLSGYVACEDFVPKEAYIKYLGTNGSSGRNLLSELPAFFEYAQNQGYIKLNFHGWNERLNNILKRYGFERLRTDSLGEFSADFYEKTLQPQKTEEQIQAERIKAFEDKFIQKVNQEYTKTLQTFKENESSIVTKINQTTETISQRINTLSDKNKLVLKLKLARHFQNNDNIDINVLIDAITETPKFLESDKGSIHRIFEIHEQKTLQKIADQRYIRAFQAKFATIANNNEIQPDNIVTDIVNQFKPQMIRESFVILDEFYNNPSFTNEQKNATFRTIEQTYHIDVFSKFNPYEALFTTSSGNYYMARLLNMPHLQQESAYMNHCVGTSNSYVNKINRGEIEILSFRKTPTINKEENKLNIDDTPLLTIEYNLKTKMIEQMKKYDDEYLQTTDPYYSDVLDALQQLRETTTDSGEKRDFKSINSSELQNISVSDYHIFTNKGEINIQDYNPNDPDVFVLKKGSMRVDAHTEQSLVEKIIEVETGTFIPYVSIALNKSQITPETKICLTEINPYNISLTELQNLTDEITYIHPDTYSKQFSFLNPKDINWQEQIQISLNQEAPKNSFTLNPETQKLNYENLGEPTILFKPEWVGKPRGEVFAEIIREYSNDYYIPGFEYQTYLAKNTDKIPQQLKDGYYYFTPGSLRGDSDGSVDVPRGSWYGSDWNRYDNYVENAWSVSYRVVLFRKSP